MERARQSNNRTGLKSFDRLASDPRVASVWSEGDDGYWFSLQPGWNIEGQSGGHGRTVRETYEEFRLIEKGNSY